MPEVLRELLINNRTFVFLIIFTSLEFFQISSNTAFLPKLIAIQFRISAAKVSLLFGLLAVPAAALGNLFGAYLQKRLNLGCLGSLKLTTIVSLITTLVTLYLFIYCGSNSVAGINTSYLNGSQSLQSGCNQNCSCAQGSFIPVCADRLTYSSPCFAGCRRSSGAKIFTNCTCLTKSSSASLGACSVSCGILPYVFYTLMFFAVFFNFVNAVPAQMATLRCVPFRLKSFAVGIQSFMMRILGTIPGPIVVGYLIDQNCLFWQQTCDNKRGSCWFYENKNMAATISLSFAICKALATLSIFIAWQMYKRELRNHKQIINSKQDINMNIGHDNRGILDTQNGLDTKL